MLRTLSINSGFLPIIIFLLFLNRNKDDKLWVIFLYTILSLITDYSYNIIGTSKKIEFYIYSFFTVIEFSLGAIFLYFNINSNLFKKILIFCSGLFFVISIYNLFQQEFENFDSLTASVECILIIFFSILFLYDQIKEPELTFISSSKKFWIIVAFFLYLSSTLFLFIYASKLTKHEMSYYWKINFVFNILKNVLFSIAFLMKNNTNNSYTNKTFLRNQYKNI